MARRGFGQAEVDEMELWVIAELLGVSDTPLTPAARARQVMAERVARAQADGVLPAGEHIDGDDPVAAQIAALRAARAQAN